AGADPRRQGGIGRRPVPRLSHRQWRDAPVTMPLPSRRLARQGLSETDRPPRFPSPAHPPRRRRPGRRPGRGGLMPKLSGYRLMWMMAMFDLPVLTKPERKRAADFRKFLLDQGFEMVQFSVY